MVLQTKQSLLKHKISLGHLNENHRFEVHLFSALMGGVVCLSGLTWGQWRHITGAKLSTATTSSQLFFCQSRLFPEWVTRTQPFLVALKTGSWNPAAPVCAVCMLCMCSIYVCVCQSLSNGVDFNVLAENNSALANKCLCRHFTLIFPSLFLKC